jgi:catalase
MPSLHRSQLFLRYTSIAVILAMLAASFAWVAGWMHAPGAARLSAARVIDAFEQAGGRHRGFRRNHAKGICVSGYFDSNGNGLALSHASVFQRGRTPVIGRFSAPGGNPSEDDALTTVRSFALRLAMTNGEEWRTGMNSAPVFAVRTPEAVVEQLNALQPDPHTGRPDPAKLEAFMVRHPETHALRDWLASHPPSSSFYDASYYSINAFRLTDAHGQTRFVRWSVVPETPYAPSAARADTAHDPDFLAHGLRTRLQNKPVSWRLMLTPAGPGDSTDDATIAWPPERERHRVDAGTLVITQAQAQIDGACRNINFDPVVLPAGISPSDDPLIAARSAAYAESYSRRAREDARANVR